MCGGGGFIYFSAGGPAVGLTWVIDNRPVHCMDGLSGPVRQVFGVDVGRTHAFYG